MNKRRQTLHKGVFTAVGRKDGAKPSAAQADKQEVQPTAPILSLKEVTLQAKNDRYLLDRVTLDVFGGEIVGIAGVEGNGQNELVEVLAGLRKIDRGEMTLNGKSITNKSVRHIRQLGLAHLVADRHRNGVNLTGRVDENLIIGHHNQLRFSRRGLLQPTAIRDFANKAIQKYRILATGIDSLIYTFPAEISRKFWLPES